MTGTTTLRESEFEALTAKISRERGFGCASYKDKCVRRRIAVRMRARGVHTYRDYARVLDNDRHEYERLLDALTINVTQFFRNPEAWASLDERVLTPLMAGGPEPLRAWSAGCASGEEAYTLALLLHRLREAAGAGARAVEVLGTDIDRASLESAERGEYAEGPMADVPAAIRARYFPGRAPYRVPAEVRALVQFARHDLLADPPPAGRFHLIVCRNVAIYLDRASQDRLLERFHEALVPGGMLMQGKVETLLGPIRSRFASVDARQRISRRT